MCLLKNIFYLILLTATSKSSFAFQHEIVLNSDVVVETTSGLVRGRLVKYNNDIEYKSFKGIPYAEPPIGHLRFKPPIEKTPWSYIHNAVEGRVACIQTEQNLFNTRWNISEDCLYLNVYVPHVPLIEPLPVYFYVHGGEFRTGSSDDALFGPQFLMKKDVILVTTNYRLGALGFLSLNIPEATGNNGIKDVLLSLKWTKNNIARFGGNPNRVTIGGFSAGSVLVNYLLLTDKSKGLFHQATMESGSALGHRFFNPFPELGAQGLSFYLCNNTNNRQELHQCLMKQNASDILAAQLKLEINDKRKAFRPFTPFVPIAEILTEHRVIAEKPIISFRKGLIQNVPVLIGGNCEEGIKMEPTVKINFGSIELLNQDPQRYVPDDLYKLDDKEREITADDIRNFFFNGGNITLENIDRYYDLITDTHYAHSINYWLKLHKARSNSKEAFYYEFCFDGVWNYYKTTNNITHAGATHGDQLSYLFMSWLSDARLKDVDERTEKAKERMVNMWANFIKTGNPTPEGFEVKWKAISYPRMNYLSVGDHLENIEHEPFQNRLDFWEELYNNYYARFTD